MLQPTPGDTWGVEQHHWNTGAEEDQQLNPGGPSKFNVGLKPLLHQGLSEPEFYDDLVYKFKKRNEGRADFSDQFRKFIVRYKRIGYNINIMRQSACLVFNPVTVNNFASLYNCTPVGRASLSDGPDIKRELI